jgi:hypothetical protein
MANHFKFTGTSLSDTNLTTLITPTGSSIFIVNSLLIVNYDTNVDSTIDLIITDTSQGVSYNILKAEPYKAGWSREVLSRPLILENLDVLKAQANDANVFNVLISYLDRDREKK